MKVEIGSKALELRIPLLLRLALEDFVKESTGGLQRGDRSRVVLVEVQEFPFETRLIRPASISMTESFDCRSWIKRRSPGITPYAPRTLFAKNHEHLTSCISTTRQDAPCKFEKLNRKALRFRKGLPIASSEGI